MTQPIQEPSDSRKFSKITFGQDQLFRRPAPPPDEGCGKFEGIVFPSTLPVTTGDDANGWFMVIPEDLNGFVLDHAEAGVYTVSSSGDVELTVRNVTEGLNVATIVIDQGDNTSYQVGGSSTINTGNAVVSTGDIYVVDVDSDGTSVEGLVIILHFCDTGGT